MPGIEFSGIGQQKPALARARSSITDPNYEGLVIAGAHAVEDGTLNPGNAVMQERSLRGPESPLHPVELVGAVTRALAKERGHLPLVRPEEMEREPRSLLSNEKGVIHL